MAYSESLGTRRILSIRSGNKAFPLLEGLGLTIDLDGLAKLVAAGRLLHLLCYMFGASATHPHAVSSAMRWGQEDLPT